MTIADILGIVDTHRALVHHNCYRLSILTMTFLLVKICLWKVIWYFIVVQLMRWPLPGAISFLFITNHNQSQTLAHCWSVLLENKITLKKLLDFHIRNIYWACSPVKLLLMLNDHSMIYSDIFGKFFCWISLDDGSHLVIVNFWKTAPVILSFLLLCKMTSALTTAAIPLNSLQQIYRWCCKLSMLICDWRWIWVRK